MLFYWIFYNFRKSYVSKIKARNIIKLNFPFYFPDNNSNVLMSHIPKVLHLKIIVLWKFATILNKLITILISNFETVNAKHYSIYTKQLTSIITFHECKYFVESIEVAIPFFFDQFMKSARTWNTYFDFEFQRSYLSIPLLDRFNNATYTVIKTSNCSFLFCYVAHLMRILKNLFRGICYITFEKYI